MRLLVKTGNGESHEVVSEGKEKKPDPAPAPAKPPPAKKPLTATGDSLAKILPDSGSAYTKTVIGTPSIRTRIAQKMGGVEFFIFHQDDSSRNADLVFVVAEPFEPFLVIGIEDVTRGQFVMTWDPGGFVRINILSHTLQTLLEGCDVDHLCNFLLRCAEDFTLIAMDKSGSHVAETALKSLALYLEDAEVFTTIEETVTKICEVVAERSVDVMSDCYGSHVIRSLLCLCKGVGFESLEEFHVTKSTITLAERLNSGLLNLVVSLKLLVGNDHELMHVISLLLGHRKLVEIFTIDGNNDLILDTAYSHLMEELGPRITELLETGKSGVVASLLAACQRLHMHEHKCCRTVTAAVYSGSESARCIVPRILFLDSYFRCEERSCWNWATAEKMHTLGCLMLQTIFRYPREFIQPYLMSLTSRGAACLFETAKDAGGGRGIESFLCSEASIKQKCKVITQLRCSFGRLSIHPSGSFTVEKCFTAANLSLREVIASELSAIQPELSRTKHGPYLLKKLDIDGYAARPDQWKSSQASKQNAYKEFVDVLAQKQNHKRKASHRRQSAPGLQR